MYGQTLSELSHNSGDEVASFIRRRDEQKVYFSDRRRDYKRETRRWW